jgi:hypothetical protein
MMLSLAGDKSSTDIVFMSRVAKEQQEYEQISPAVNFGIESTIFRVGKLFLEANELTWTQISINFPDLCPSPDA